jgi:two-component system, response regulator
MKGKGRPAGTLLLVEDDKEDADLLGWCLEKAKGPTVHRLCDGQEALDYVMSRPDSQLPKVIVLDLRLPKLSGLEVLHRLRSEARTRHIPVVVLTVSTSPEDVASCYALGANSYVVKPSNAEAMLETAHRLASYWLTYNETT